MGALNLRRNNNDKLLSQNRQNNKEKYLNDNFIKENEKVAKNVNFEAVKNEYEDILPTLKYYFDSKSKNRQGLITQERVEHNLEKLVIEINEFITVLKSNSCCESERKIIEKLHI